MRWYSMGTYGSAIECKLDRSFLMNYYEHLPAASDLIYDLFGPHNQ